MPVTTGPNGRKSPRLDVWRLRRFEEFQAGRADMLIPDQAEPGMGPAVGDSLAAKGVFRAAAVFHNVPPAGYLEQDGVLLVCLVRGAFVIH
jgi:hypothetical protein